MQKIVETLSAHGPEIIKHWVDALASVATTQGITHLQLVETIPEYLATLGKAAGTGPITLTAEQTELIERHVSARLRQGAALYEMVTEFAILGRCILQFFEAEAPESARLLTELHLATILIEKVFNEHLLEDQQLEKRYDRRIRAIAAEGTGGFVDRLGEVLEVIREATGASAVSLVLLDDRTHQIPLARSAGPAGPALQGYVLGVVGPGRGSIPPGTSQSLPISSTLRSAGIGSLACVLAPAGASAHCALYVALAEARSFTASERRRIESLADTVARHLEGAANAAHVQDRVESLEVEEQLRSRFAAALMDEISEPLADARRRLRDLTEHLEAGEDQASAQTIARDLQHIDEIATSALDLYHIRIGKRPRPVLGECDLSAIAHGVAERFRASDRHRLVLECEPGMWGVWGEVQLRRAITNLVANALQHGAPGAQVTITTRRGRNGAELAVHNQGPTLSPEKQAAMFRPFAPAATPGRPSERGWGMGLTLVWGYVDAHGGRVIVESAPGEGTTFRLSIPYDARAHLD